MFIAHNNSIALNPNYKPEAGWKFSKHPGGYTVTGYEGELIITVCLNFMQSGDATAVILFQPVDDTIYMHSKEIDIKPTWGFEPIVEYLNSVVASRS